MIIWADGTKQKFRGEKLKQRQTQKDWRRRRQAPRRSEKPNPALLDLAL